MAGMFRITGSVAATTNSDADKTVNEDFSGISHYSCKTVPKTQSWTSSLPQPIISSVQEVRENSTKKVSSPPSFDRITASEGHEKHKHQIPKRGRKPASFAGFPAVVKED